MLRTTAIVSSLLSALLLITALVPGWLLVTVIIELFTDDSMQRPILETQVIRDTLVWTALVMFGAVIPGIPAGVLLGRLLLTRFGGLAAAATVLSLCLPGYAIFWFWWQGFGPDGFAGSWFLTRGLSVELREGLLLLALIAWTWPLVAWPVALATMRRSSCAAHAALDGMNSLTRACVFLRATGLQIIIGMLLVGFMVSTATISFDLAQVRTFGFELRAFDALGYPASALMRFAMPVIILALVGAATGVLFFFRTTARRSSVDVRGGAVRATGVGSFLLLGAPAVLVLLMPILSAGLASGDLDFSVFSRLHGTAALRSFSNALVAATMCTVLGGIVFVSISCGRPMIRTVACLLGGSWIACCLLPGTVVAAAVTRMFNGPSLGPILYDTGWALSFGHLAAAGGISVLIALLMCLLESRSMTMMRALDVFRLDSCRPRLVVVAVLAFLSTMVFTLGDLILGARLAPPGLEGVGGSLLNAMHYQRPDTVVVVLGILVGLAGLLAIACGLLLPRRFQGMLGMFLLITLVSLPLSGCDSKTDSSLEVTDGSDAVPSTLVVGAPGRAPGLFETPRGIALDPERKVFYVVDKTARIQRFGFDGRFQHEWPMPESEVGKPVGLSVAPDGRVFVADTHYHRIVVFDSEGTELERFGSFGTGPGEFVYPTDIAFAGDGTMFVAEYGTNDRIQVFSRDGAWLRTIGSNGRGDGALARPQSIALSLDETELYVSDSCNHRISVFSVDGTWRRHLGQAGREVGAFNYPYGLHVLADGSLLVSEYGGDRIQRIDPEDGRSLGCWGGTGFVKGRLHMPWGVGAADGRLFVLDSGNSRVQIGKWMPGPSLSETAPGPFID